MKKRCFKWIAGGLMAVFVLGAGFTATIGNAAELDKDNSPAQAQKCCCCCADSKMMGENKTEMKQKCQEKMQSPEMKQKCEAKMKSHEGHQVKDADTTAEAQKHEGHNS